MCCLGVSAGLRSGELRAVTFEQMIEHKLPSGEVVHGLIIDRAINNRGEFVGLKKSKEDDPRERAVILSEKTVRILNLYLEKVKRKDGLMFLHRGRPIRKETLARRWAAGLKQAGIAIAGRRLTPHAMRYTYNTKMKMLLPDQVLREVIGHRSEEMTALYDRPHLEERLLQLADQHSLFERFWNL
jgi:integrase